MRICVVGDREDLSAVYLAWRVRERGGEVLELWEDAYGVDWTVSGTVSEDQAELRFRVRGDSYASGDLTGMIVRLNPRPEVPREFGMDEAASAVYTLERRYGLQFVADHLGVPVVNRPSQGRANSSKPYQMLALERSGFRVPAWCVTNVRDRARRFLEGCPNGAIYKACSGLRARVRRVDDALLHRLAGSCPVVLQEYISGTDVRVHVVGERSFGSRVISDAIDYRFDSLPIHYEVANVPERVARACVAHCRAEGLLVAGLDFRCTPDGDWWCLESNPVPTFLPYEAGTGQPIGDAIVDLFGRFPIGPPAVSPLWQLAQRETPRQQE
jgi:hypothetical protein